MSFSRIRLVLGPGLWRGLQELSNGVCHLSEMGWLARSCWRAQGRWRGPVCLSIQGHVVSMLPGCRCSGARGLSRQASRLALKQLSGSQRRAYSRGGRLQLDVVARQCQSRRWTCNSLKVRLGHEVHAGPPGWNQEDRGHPAAARCGPKRHYDAGGRHVRQSRVPRLVRLDLPRLDQQSIAHTASLAARGDCT